MTDKPKYRYDNGEIVEVSNVWFGRRDYWNTESEEEHNEAYNAWLEHQKSLRRYPAPNWPESLKGVDLEEGKHFKIEKRSIFHAPDKKPLGNTGALDASHGFYTDTVAIPILPAQPEQKAHGEQDNKDIVEVFSEHRKMRKLLAKITGIEFWRTPEEFEKAWDSTPPSQDAEYWRKRCEAEAIDFAEWAGIEMWQYDLGSKIWMKAYDDGIHDQYTSEELYQLFLKHKQQQ